MKIYTYRDRGERAGQRIEAEVIVQNGGYSATCFRHVGDPGEAGGWELVTRTYKTLARFLTAMDKRGIYVDGASCGIN